MPGRGPGLSGWSAYNTLRRVSPDALVVRLVAGAAGATAATDGGGRSAPPARRVGGFTALVESDARRRIAEEKGARARRRRAVRPSIDRLDFTAARRDDIEEMRRQIYPLARRLATRLAKEQHARRRGPLDFRRTVRASVSTGGVPLTTHHRPKRPHRTELVVLCDVSGSVANFASFTLLLVFALREQFSKVRAFTFVDDVHEVTDDFRPGADPASAWPTWPRAPRTPRAGGAPTTAARSASSRGGTPTRSARSPGCWCSATRARTTPTRRCPCCARWSARPGTPGGSTPSTAAVGHRRLRRPAYGEVVPMVECRNLTQLGEFVHDLV